MDVSQIGVAAAFALAAAGTTAGYGPTGTAVMAAWKKCYAQNKTPSFLYFIFLGVPLSQTFYGLILMLQLKAASAAGTTDPGMILGAGLFGGFALGFSAYWQGLMAGAGADALSATGKGFANYILVCGMVEAIALFIMVFLVGLAIR